METLLELGKQVPALAVLVVVVWVFVRHIEKTQEHNRDTWREMQSENINARAESREVIRENTISAKQNTQAVNELTNAVRLLESKR